MDLPIGGSMGRHAPAFLPPDGLEALICALHEDGRTVIGPMVVDDTIVLGQVQAVDDLPVGCSDSQQAGRYRVERGTGHGVFGFNLGPTSWKRWTYPARVPIGSTHVRADGTTVFGTPTPQPERLAFLGARACELEALRIHDTVLTAGPYVDADYASRRAAVLIVAVNCTTAASTCFCTSMGSGPEVTAGYDMALTELAQGGFLVEAATPAGEAIVADLPTQPMTIDQAVAAAQSLAAVRARIGDQVATAGLHDRLLANLDHERWAEVAQRCLTCANCTLVCPTCFCTSIDRLTDLDSRDSLSVRVWDSCFTGSFGIMAEGVNVRARPKDRYRQWLTHKFATWWDQFGSWGCVGCGRCITFCPAAIDIREELAAIAPATPPPPPPPPVPPIPAARQEYVPATLEQVRVETRDTRTLRLRGLDEVHASGEPGQFVMVSLPGQPPAAISVSRYLPPDGIELTVRAAGPATTELTELQPGAVVGIRGPVGNGWPTRATRGRDVVIVTGGTGLAPLRGLIDHVLATRAEHGEIHLYYGARTAGDLLFAGELEQWAAREDLTVHCRWLDQSGRVDPSAGAGPGRATVSAIHRATWDGANAMAFVCGPERMMEATAIALAGRGIARDRIWVTLERHMECGVGLCGHCQLGRWFICRDGPVFPLTSLEIEFGREGL